MLARSLVFALLAASAAEAAEATPVLTLDAGGHTDDVTGIFFLPGNKEVVTASADKTVRVWDVASRSSVRTLRVPVGPGLEGKITASAMLPGGTTLAVAVSGVTPKSPSTVYLIDIKTGRFKAVLKGHNRPVFSMAADSKGERLVSGDADGKIRVWNVSREGEEKEERLLEGHTGHVAGLAFSPDGASLLSGGFDKQAVIWDVAHGQAKVAVRKHEKEIFGVAWSPDGKTLATCSLDRSVCLLDPEGGVRSWLLDPTNTKWTQPNGVTSVRFAPKTGRLIYSLGLWNDDDYTVQVVDLTTGEHRSSPGSTTRPGGRPSRPTAGSPRRPAATRRRPNCGVRPPARNSAS